jgi:hypothetical protein
MAPRSAVVLAAAALSAAMFAGADAQAFVPVRARFTQERLRAARERCCSCKALHLG